MRHADNDILDGAIAHNAAAVLSLPSAGMLRHHKTRFLAAEDGGFWVESDEQDLSLVDELIVRRQPVGLAFKSQNHKIVFLSPITRRVDSFALNDHVKVPALLLEYPADVKIVQRRGSYRVRVPSDVDVSARVWRVPEHAILRDRPMAAAELAVQIRDLSLSGMGLLCQPTNHRPQRLVVDERLRILLRRGDSEALIEGRVRHCERLGDDSLKVGVQFRDRQDSIDDRQNQAKLSSIVGQLQREEVRRMRIGILGPRPAESA